MWKYKNWKKDHLSKIENFSSVRIGKPYSVTIYDDPSHEVLENAKATELNVKVYSLLVGL